MQNSEGVVALYTYLGVVQTAFVPGHVWDERHLHPPSTVCQETYVQVTKAMPKANRIREIASAFITKHFGGRPFLAMHVRCAKAWQGFLLM